MLSVLFGYLAGSVPFAFLLARKAGVDVRLAGSGNVGAANVLRTAGAGRGGLVLMLGVAKGAAPVWSTRYVSLGSVSATLALPPVAWLAGAPRTVVLAAGGTGILILFRHRA